MKRTSLRNVTICALLHSPPSNPYTNQLRPTSSFLRVAVFSSSRFRFYSSENDPSIDGSTHVPPSKSLAQTQNKDVVEVEDVSNKELKTKIDKYFIGEEEEALPEIFEAIMKRRLSGKHEETDNAVIDELEFRPCDEVDDRDFESDFEDAHKTDEEIDDLYNARDIVKKKMVKDEYFNMDDKKWDNMVEDAIKHGYMKDTKECEEILQDMLSWDKLLPDWMKKKVEKKFNQLGDKCEKGELEPEQAYTLFKEFEDKLVAQYMKQMEEEETPKFDELALPDKKKDSDDPPGDGPILQWQTRVVFSPGGDAWHPKTGQ